MAVCKPGDTILGMNLSHGGHLTHGHPLNFSGRIYKVVAYGVRKEDERIDYDAMAALAARAPAEGDRGGRLAPTRASSTSPAVRRAADAVRRGGDGGHRAHRGPDRGRAAPEPGAARGVRDHHHAQDAARPARRPGHVPEKCAKDLDRRVFPGVQGGPLMHVIAAKAVAFKEALAPEFKAYQRQIVANAKALAATLMGEGWRLVSGGTDNHLLLIDVFARGITGKVAEEALDRAGITVNKNTIPFDRTRPWSPRASASARPRSPRAG